MTSSLASGGGEPFQRQWCIIFALSCLRASTPSLHTKPPHQTSTPSLPQRFTPGADSQGNKCTHTNTHTPLPNPHTYKKDTDTHQPTGRHLCALSALVSLLLGRAITLSSWGPLQPMTQMETVINPVYACVCVCFPSDECLSVTAMPAAIH